MPRKNPPSTRVDAGEKPRPHVPITAAQIEGLALIQCTRVEAAAFFGCSYRTLLRKLKDPELRAAWRKGRSTGRISLRREQWKMAQGGNGPAARMLEFLGKNWLGQSDRTHHEVAGDGGGPLSIAFDPATLAGLTTDELKTLETIFAKVAGAGTANGGADRSPERDPNGAGPTGN